MAQPTLKETDLYPPIKSLLESQGYEVKGEIGAADVVAVRGAEDPVIVELKTGFSLSLFHQAIERQRVTDAVYVAVPRRPGRSFIATLRKNKALCRRLGLGLITVRMKDRHVEIHVDPAPYKPRQMKGKKAKLLKEFSMRVGDPNVGGSNRRPLMTAYRQDALCCLNYLHGFGPMKAAIVAEQSGVEWRGGSCPIITTVGLKESRPASMGSAQTVIAPPLNMPAKSRECRARTVYIAIPAETLSLEALRYDTTG